MTKDRKQWLADVRDDWIPASESPLTISRAAKAAEVIPALLDIIEEQWGEIERLEAVLEEAQADDSGLGEVI